VVEREEQIKCNFEQAAKVIAQKLKDSAMQYSSMASQVTEGRTKAAQLLDANVALTGELVVLQMEKEALVENSKRFQEQLDENSASWERVVKEVQTAMGALDQELTEQNAEVLRLVEDNHQ